MGGGMALLLSPPFICSAGGFGGGKVVAEPGSPHFFKLGESQSFLPDWDAGRQRGRWMRWLEAGGCSVGGCQWLWLQPPSGEALGFSSWFSH